MLYNSPQEKLLYLNFASVEFCRIPFFIKSQIQLGRKFSYALQSLVAPVLSIVRLSDLGSLNVIMPAPDPL
jgi:hypothetical protein